MRMNLIAPRCERGLSQKTLQKSTALCKSSLRLANVCSREKGAGQTKEPSKVPTAGKRSFVVAPMGSGYVVLYWLSRQFQEDNSTSADDTLYFLSPLSSLVLLAPFAVAHKHTLSLPCCHLLAFGQPHIAIWRLAMRWAAEKRLRRIAPCATLRTCTYVACLLC